MKKMKAIAVVALMAGAVASMQAESYNRVTVGYNADIFMGDKSGLYNLDGLFDEKGPDLDGGLVLSGFNVQYSHGFGIVKKLPLFVEVGLRLSTGFQTKSEEIKGTKISATTSKLDLTVPANIVYKWDLGSGMSLSPYTGLHFKANLLGQVKSKVTFMGESDTETFNFFSKDDIPSKDYRWSRVQAGWQVGVGFSYSLVYFGLEYGIDFNRLYKDCTSSNFMFNVGLNF